MSWRTMLFGKIVEVVPSERDDDGEWHPETSEAIQRERDEIANMRRRLDFILTDVRKHDAES